MVLKNLEGKGNLGLVARSLVPGAQPCLMAHIIEYLLSIKLYLKKQPSGNWGPGSVAEHGLSLSAVQ